MLQHPQFTELYTETVQQIALQRRAQYIGDFMGEVQCFKTEQFVWIDESGVIKGTIFVNFDRRVTCVSPIFK